MTHQQSILAHLHEHPDLCDDCLATRLGIQPRQTVNALCRSLNEQIVRMRGPCSSCSVRKLLNAPGASLVSSAASSPKPQITKSRNLDVGARFNEALISVLPFGERDYYGDLSFVQMLKLKQGLARIHDAVTLKLTFELVNWIATRFSFSSEQKSALWAKVDNQSANASGFDVQWDQPQIIAEVKGCIPMNGGNVFGSAQFKGLTNDLRQMLGQPSLGKTKEQLSSRSKVHHPANMSSIKLLALYESAEVRKAIAQWKRSIESQTWFVELTPRIKLEDAPDSGPPNDPAKVYLVYLSPTHS